MILILGEIRYLIFRSEKLSSLFLSREQLKNTSSSIDTSGGKHFTTADNASGSERCSVNVRAIQSIVYQKSDLIEDIVNDQGKTKVTPDYA